MLVKKAFVILSVVLTFLPVSVFSQKKHTVTAKKNNATTVENCLTISYNIDYTSSSKPNVAELYNGGVQTYFTNSKRIRLRLVTLARIQSVFVTPNKKKDQPPVVTFIKESGDKYKFTLTSNQWIDYMKDYDNTTQTITDDTATILGYLCKKAIIKTKDDDEIIAYYTDSLNSLGFKIIMPLFKSIPGTVLKYSVVDKKFTLTYTATTVTINPIDKSVFFIPVTGYALKNYIKGAKGADLSDLLKEEPEPTANEEEEDKK